MDFYILTASASGTSLDNFEKDKFCKVNQQYAEINKVTIWHNSVNIN